MRETHSALESIFPARAWPCGPFGEDVMVEDRQRLGGHRTDELLEPTVVLGPLDGFVHQINRDVDGLPPQK